MKARGVLEPTTASPPEFRRRFVASCRASLKGRYFCLISNFKINFFRRIDHRLVGENQVQPQRTAYIH